MYLSIGMIVFIGVCCYAIGTEKGNKKPPYVPPPRYDQKTWKIDPYGNIYDRDGVWVKKVHKYTEDEWNNA